MKTYFVKIDLKSIKKNKDAGSESTIIPGKFTISFEAEHLPDYFIDGENCIINESTLELEGDTEILTNVKGIIRSEELMERLRKEKPEGFIINMERDIQTIRHFPIPDYSYKFENTVVECKECGKSIMTDDLVSESFDYNEGYSYNICPHCGEIDCCVLEYEKIEEALIRKKGL